MSTPIDTTSLLRQLGTLAREAGVPPANAGAGGADAASRVSGRVEGVSGAGTVRDSMEAEGVDFAGMVADSLRAVDARSDVARSLTVDFERGKPGVELADVMIAVQKARVSFEALTQVRNKMVAAYKDILNTPL